MVLLRAAAFLIVVAYPIVPLARVGGALGHDLAHRARGEDPMHHHHPHDHHPHDPPHGHGDDAGHSGHDHDVVLRFLLGLQETDARAESSRPSVPAPDAPRFDHLVPAAPWLAAASDPVACIDGRDAASLRSVEHAPPSPPPRQTA
jgi:hypothetical protein